jgi:RHS repeat-associated protein
MSAVLASPCRIKRNHRRRRAIASGRRDYNYFRDYDSGTGRYTESDPIGLRGGISTFGYVGGNPLSHRDPYGLDDPSLELYASGVTNRMPDRTAPQAAVDYVGGVSSYVSGLASMAEQAAWSQGLMGDAYKDRADRNDKILTAILKALKENPELRKQAECYAKNWALNHKVYLAGRYSAGIAAGIGTETGPVGSAALSGLAASGNVYGEIDSGANTANQVVNALLNGTSGH